MSLSCVPQLKYRERERQRETERERERERERETERQIGREEETESDPLLLEGLIIAFTAVPALQCTAAVS